MKVYNFEQQSEEWFNIRKGKMTASHAQAIGNNGKGLDSYILEIMSCYYSSAERELYTNADLERGNELEAQARDMYELETGNKVEQVGFVEHNEFVGCSPDGLVNDDGGIEIKSPKDVNHFKLLIDGKIDTKYIWQIQMNLLITESKWWDFISYNPNYKKSLFIKRIYPDEEMQEKLLKGFEIGTQKIKEIIKNYE